VGKINAPEIIAEVSRRMQCTKQDTKELIQNILFEVIFENLRKGDVVNLHPYGRFYLKPAGRVQKNGKKRMIVKFRPSKTMQNKISSFIDSYYDQDGLKWLTDKVMEYDRKERKYGKAI